MNSHAPSMGTAHEPLTGGLRFVRTDGVALRFQRGRGGLVYTEDGTPYVDFILGMGPVSIGHANPEFTRRLAAVLDQGVLLPTFAPVHEQYAALLLEDAPDARIVNYFTSGSEAVTAALRLAALETGRLGVVRCGYVGWHDAQLAHSPNWNEPVGAGRRHQVRFTNHMRGARGDERVANWVDFELTSLEQLLADRTFGAFVLDAYQAATLAEDIIAAALRLCRARGVIVILDETKTAGRRGRGGAFTHTAIRGDLTVLGKAIANGLPLSVLVQHRDFASVLAHTRVGGTFARACVSIHAAIITAELMREWHGYEQLAETGRRVVALLQEALHAVGVDNLVTCQPLVDGCLFEFRYAPALVNDVPARAALERAFLDHGILLFEGHCAFVCLDHRTLAWPEVARAAEQALRAWRAGRHC